MTQLHRLRAVQNQKAPRFITSGALSVRLRFSWLNERGPCANALCRGEDGESRVDGEWSGHVDDVATCHVPVGPSNSRNLATERTNP
jgi:hypothetical protein